MLTRNELEFRLSLLVNQLQNGCGCHGCIIKKPDGQGRNKVCGCSPMSFSRTLKQLSLAVNEFAWPEESEAKG